MASLFALAIMFLPYFENPQKNNTTCMKSQQPATTSVTPIQRGRSLCFVRDYTCHKPFRNRTFGISTKLLPDLYPEVMAAIRVSCNHFRDLTPTAVVALNRITFATSTCSCGVTGPRIRPATLLFVRTFPRPSWSSSSPAAGLPGGLVALYDGGRNETALWLPEQRALVFADALTAPGGELRVWASPSHKKRALPALRALLELPFERAIVSHGEPVHTRAAYERALELAPWGGKRTRPTSSWQPQSGNLESH
jgi:hypothetical protein